LSFVDSFSLLNDIIIDRQLRTLHCKVTYWLWVLLRTEFDWIFIEAWNCRC